MKYALWIKYMATVLRHHFSLQHCRMSANKLCGCYQQPHRGAGLNHVIDEVMAPNWLLELSRAGFNVVFHQNLSSLSGVRLEIWDSGPVPGSYGIAQLCSSFNTLPAHCDILHSLEWLYTLTQAFRLLDIHKEAVDFNSTGKPPSNCEGDQR